MKRVERMLENISGPVSEEVFREKAKEGWHPVAIEWMREAEGTAPPAEALRTEIPYGLRAVPHSAGLEVDPGERRILERMLDLIVTEKSFREVTDELNRQGFRTRTGSRWTEVAVFNMLPRLIDTAPELRRSPEQVG